MSGSGMPESDIFVNFAIQKVYIKTTMKEKFKHYTNWIGRYKYIWTFLLFTLIIGVLDTNSLLNRREIRRQNELLREEIAHYEEQFEAGRKELRALRNDPDVVEEVARMKLFMKTPNEDIYIIESSRPKAQ
jgi:cell division protein FtsB